jgi:hypothetical protein
MDIKVEKGIPIPEKFRHAEYPFETMEVGDSFLVPGKVEDSARTQSGLSARARKLVPKKFVTSAVEGGVRVWRKE